MPATPTVTINQTVRVRAISPESAADDVRCVITAPSDTSTTVLLSDATVLTEIEAGRIYQCTHFLDETGDWIFRFENLNASDVVIGLDEQIITVVAATT